MNQALGWDGSLQSSQLASPGMETPPYSWQMSGGREPHSSLPLLSGLDPLQYGFGGGGTGMRTAQPTPSCEIPEPPTGSRREWESCVHCLTQLEWHFCHAELGEKEREQTL